MTAERAFDPRWNLEPQRKASRPERADPSALLGAVREDIRQTLRTGWIDPALEAAASYPAFFTAAWSAIRPNIGKSFLILARALRTEAVDMVRATMPAPDLRPTLRGQLSDEEVRRLEDSARAAHLATAKAQVVVHEMYRAVRRERIPGTGREEPPIRRGVPEWQLWMSFQPSPEPSRAILDEAAMMYQLPTPPIPLQLLARWPVALSDVWSHLKPVRSTRSWTDGVNRLRRMVLAGVATLPHPVELQWTALRARGFIEANRVEVADVLSAFDTSMASQTLTAALTWLAFGAPEIGVEG